MEIIMYLVDAFSDKKFSGNPAGVVPDASELNSDDMQRIAAEINLSETAFVKKIDEDNYEVRFFTPTQEVDLCGHATIATFYTLASKGYLRGIDSEAKRFFQHTKAGKLYVDVYCSDGEIENIVMEQASPKVIGTVENNEKIAKALNIEVNNLGLNTFNIEAQIISTGLPDIIVPVKNKAILDNINMDKEKVERISKELESTGIHVFTIEKNQVYTRNFAPLVGIDEEAATGTANGALFYYLRKNNVTDKKEMLINQGEILNRPSEILCKISDSNPNSIEVGGKASIIIEGVIHC